MILHLNRALAIAMRDGAETGLAHNRHGTGAWRLPKQPDGEVLITDGPYTKTKEQMGGFWILEAANLDEALAWAKKAAIFCHAVGEVRELLLYPAPEQVLGGSE